MPLTLYNTLTRRKEVFEPLDPARVRMYVCGPTVYDFAHIGNARPVIVFDVLYRLLRHQYGTGHVTYVRNITDIDDKINKAARDNNETIRDVTERTAKAYREDVAALGNLDPDHQPRATEHVAKMIALITTLIERGHAYVAEGHVLFSVGSMKDYGKLSRRSQDELLAGARVDVAPYKRDPGDFVLWKPSTPDLPGWESPWGRGRPGWHIECSAMAEIFLGETFDIHGGGLDLIFPHHENEIAQSECAHGGKPLARYWMHNAFVNFEGEKMSKSLGNFRTIRDVLAQAPGEAARYAMLTAHYRDPIDFTAERLQQAKQTLDRYYLALRSVEDVAPTVGSNLANPVRAALEDDLNTPEALTELHKLLTALNKANDGEEQARLKGALLAGGCVLGMLQQDPEAWLRGGAQQETGEIESLITARNAARKARNFAEADRIRTDLALKGILLEDRPDGTTLWRRAS
ncbi:MAG TPA: cysteine--tRNA ligase [Stellaceae bacterium]|nr:cysteine--tRNA ligase [Stellaceae bacterium]